MIRSETIGNSKSIIGRMIFTQRICLSWDASFAMWCSIQGPMKRSLSLQHASLGTPYKAFWRANELSKSGKHDLSAITRVFWIRNMYPRHIKKSKNNIKPRQIRPNQQLRKMADVHNQRPANSFDHRGGDR